MQRLAALKSRAVAIPPGADLVYSLVLAHVVTRRPESVSSQAKALQEGQWEQRLRTVASRLHWNGYLQHRLGQA